MSPPTDPSASDLKLTVTRDFDLAPEQVYDAWLDPQALGRWLFATPDGEMKRVEVDPRVGGRFTISEQRGDMLSEHFGEYLELDRPRRIVFAFSTTGEPAPTRVEVDIKPTPGGCRLTLSHDVPPKWAHFMDRARHGWTMILDGLSGTLLADREIVSFRVFDAPREQVFRAFSDPERLARWFGPAGFTNTFEEFDLRPGGVWRFTMHGPDGADFHNENVFVEVAPPERIVYEHRQPIHRFFMTMMFGDRGARTAVTWRMLFDTPADCDKFKVFIVPANEQNFDRLAQLLAEESAHPSS